MLQIAVNQFENELSHTVQLNDMQLKPYESLEEEKEVANILDNNQLLVIQRENSGSNFSSLDRESKFNVLSITSRTADGSLLVKFEIGLTIKV